MKKRTSGATIPAEERRARGQKLIGIRTTVEYDARLSELEILRGTSRREAFEHAVDHALERARKEFK